MGAQPADVHAIVSTMSDIAVAHVPDVVARRSELEIAKHDHKAVMVDLTNEQAVGADADNQERARVAELLVLEAKMPTLAAVALRGGDESEYDRVADEISTIQKKREMYRQGRKVLQTSVVELQRAVDEPASRVTDCTARLATAIQRAKVVIAQQRLAKG